MVFCRLLLRKIVVRKMKLHYSDVKRLWCGKKAIRVSMPSYITERVAVIDDEQHFQSSFVKVLLFLEITFKILLTLILIKLPWELYLGYAACSGAQIPPKLCWLFSAPIPLLRITPSPLRLGHISALSFTSNFLKLVLAQFQNNCACVPPFFLVS